VSAAVTAALSRLPPSGAVAGVYAAVDEARGVWKAPANVALRGVLAPAEQISDFGQQELTLDPAGGKSVNALRAFASRGTLVWGARTLAGNDDEWRYVPVRRFISAVEASVSHGTQSAVFEPNAAPLWQTLKTSISNYLSQKWRAGALAGAKTSEAFFVKVGLGETMTVQDVADGRLVIDMGLAVLRPAEFIIVRVQHRTAQP
jgi:phage tail sheath protein FI